MFSLLFTNLRRGFLAGTSYTLYGNGNSNHTQRTTPKLRSRERPAHQNGNARGHRSQMPPPLPKSVSLPLHTKRGSQVSSLEKASSGCSHHLNSSSFALSSAPSIGIQPRFPCPRSFGRSTRAPHLFSHNLHRLLPYHDHDHLLPCLPPRP